MTTCFLTSICRIHKNLFLCVMAPVTAHRTGLPITHVCHRPDTLHGKIQTTDSKRTTVLCRTLHL